MKLGWKPYWSYTRYLLFTYFMQDYEELGTNPKRYLGSNILEIAFHISIYLGTLFLHWFVILTLIGAVLACALFLCNFWWLLNLGSLKKVFDVYKCKDTEITLNQGNSKNQKWHITSPEHAAVWPLVHHHSHLSCPLHCSLFSQFLLVVGFFLPNRKDQN